MTDISVDFDRLRISALRKAIQISSSIDRTTLGPNSSPDANEDVENSKNTCNIAPPQKSTGPSTSKSKNGVTFSIEKILHENEMQRREEVRRAVDKRRREMHLFQSNLQEKMVTLRRVMAQQRQQEMAEQRARLEAEEARLAQQDEIKRRHEAQLQAQRIQERQEKLEREAEEHRRLKEYEEFVEKISSCRVCFSDKCKEIAQVAKTIKNKSLIGQIVSQFTLKLRELSQQMDVISELGSSGSLTKNEVTKAEEIVSQADEILALCRAEVTKVNEMYDEMVKREEESARLVEATVPDGPTSLPKSLEIANPDSSPNENAGSPHVSESSSTETIEGDGGVIDGTCRQIYLDCHKYLEQYKASYRDLLNSNATIKFQNECNKTVNFLMKKIAPTSGAFLMEVVGEFKMLFEGGKAPYVTKLPQGVAFCKNLVAEIFIEKVEDFFVRRNTKWIYALAGVTVCLWADYPDLGELIFAHLRISCPYIIPVLLPRYQGQSAEDFYKSRGYKYVDGVRENEDEFMQRMSNLTKFYGAIIVTRLSRNINKPHPHGLGNAWRLLAAILNSEPQHDAVKTYARVIKDMLEVVGNAMWAAYPMQFPKLLMVLAKDYYPLLQRYEGDSNFAMSPLKDFLNECITRRSIPPPDGQLPINFW